MESRIEKIDQNATLKSTKTKDNWTLKKYNLDKVRKVQIECVDDPFWNEFFSEYYIENGFMFCQKFKLKAPYLSKGVRRKEDPVGELTEIIRYFQSNTLGVELSRSIEYFEGSNIDSLKKQLEIKVFDTLKIGKTNYQSAKSSYRFIKKMF